MDQVKGLELGRIVGKAKDFILPVDIIARKNAVIGVSGCGKTCVVAKIEEELCRVGLPFAVIDTVGVHLGLRAKKNGTPSGLPVVIFGGKRGDLPIPDDEIGFGARLAETVLSSSIPLVIDLSKTRREVTYRIVAEFAATLMENESEDARHIIVEESPELIPQKLKFKGQDRAHDELERLVTLGRNNGYAVTMVGQRWATVEKTCLAQVENFFIMRTTTKDDRKRLREIFDEIAPDADVSECFRSMAKLEDGEAWFFSPQWLKRFERVKFHERDTFHPGETRKVGVKLTQVDMGDVKKFVAQLSKALTRTIIPRTGDRQIGTKTGRFKASEPNLSNVPRSTREIEREIDREIPSQRKMAKEMEKLADLEEVHRIENARLKNENAALSSQREWAIAQHRKALEFLRPEYDKAQKLIRIFEEIRGDETPGASNGDASDYAPWLQKSGRVGAKRMLEVVIQRGRLRRSQLQTLAGVSRATFFRGLSWMKTNHLVEVTGPKSEDEVIRKPLS